MVGLSRPQTAGLVTVVRGAGNAIVQLGRTDPEAARRLLELYVTDPAVRAQAEASLARGDAVSSSIYISNGNVVFRKSRGYDR